MRRKKTIVSACIAVFLYNFFGIGDYLLSLDFNTQFNYPLNTDLNPIVEEVLSGEAPSVKPINHYPYKFIGATTKCSHSKKIDLVIMVKSALEHFERRSAIRLTYGRKDVVPDKIVKIVFFLGIHREPDPEVNNNVVRERAQFSDIIQLDFEDNYYNMTIKTMMSFRWAYEHCNHADYYLFTDDDMYISVKNLLKYVDLPSSNVPSEHRASESGVRRMIARNKAYESHFFAGHVIQSAPQRFYTSKWRVSLEEYPWDRWPPYVTAGAYIVSNKSMRVIYVASAFVKHFRFDDIYLGIIAKKLYIKLTHSDNFHFYKKRYTKEGYKNVIASHGYSDPRELISVWNEQDAIVNDGQY